MVVNVEKDQDRMTDRFTPEKMLGLKISDNLNLIKKIESGLPNLTFENSGCPTLIK